MAARPFRFGVVVGGARSGAAWVAQARRAEALGYATLMVPDTLAYTLAPFPALAFAAAATTTLRVGTYVLANDLRNPVLVAKDAATLDFLSSGRLELGLGAGRPGAEADNRMLGIPFEPGGARLARLAEALPLIKALLAGERVSAPGPYYTVAEAAITPAPIQRPHPPILIAGGGPRMLELAAREADIVALAFAPDEPEAGVAERVAILRAAAGARFAALELTMSLSAVGGRAVRYIAAQYGDRTAALLGSGAVAVVGGTVEDMCAQLVARRASLGFSYIQVADELMEAFAPVVARLAGQ
jgi:probable F420-dependent oxidoreductase